jgi:protein involved in polysaccharide export with SLBB domain
MLKAAAGLAVLLLVTAPAHATTPATPGAEAPVVQPGDVLRLELPGEPSLTGDFEVDRNGHVTLPEAGPTVVAGLPAPTLRTHLRERLAVAFRDLQNLTVTVRERRLLVSVLGYVESPGEVVLPASANVQTALQAAGGLRSGAQLDRMTLRRGELALPFDYKAHLDGGDPEQLPALASLDVIFVPASPRVGNVEMPFDASTLSDAGDAGEARTAIKLFGEVNHPGSFSHRDEATILDYLMRAGGVTRFAGVEQIRVIVGARPELFDLKRYLDTGDQSLLPTISPGATVFVPRQEEEVKVGENVIYVMGEVFKPGAYESKPEAGFLDVLANAGGPTRYAETRQIRVLRTDGAVVPFDLAAFTEGRRRDLPPVRPGDAIFVPEKTDLNEKSWLKVAPERAVHVIGAVVRPGRYEWSDEMSLMDLLAHAGGPGERADTGRIEISATAADGATRVLFDLDAYLENGADPARLPPIRAGTTVRVPAMPQSLVDNKSQWLNQPAQESIYIFGQVGAPGRYRFDAAMSFLDILAAADGPTQQADLHRIRVNHAAYYMNDVTEVDLMAFFATGNHQLLPRVEPGDSIYVPERDIPWLDEPSSNTVRVLGAVQAPGRYRFDHTMTVLDLLAEAGGTRQSAHRRFIMVVHGEGDAARAERFDLQRFSRTADFDALPDILPGDTVYVPDRSERFAARAREGLTALLQAVTLAVLAGGL